MAHPLNFSSNKQNPGGNKWIKPENDNGLWHFYQKQVLIEEIRRLEADHPSPRPRVVKKRLRALRAKLN